MKGSCARARAEGGDKLRMRRARAPRARLRRRGDPCRAQIVMSANKEAVLSEKELRAGFGQRVLVGYSEVIRSGDFPDVPAFVRAVQAEWDRQWRRVYAADWAGTRAPGARAKRPPVPGGQPGAAGAGLPSRRAAGEAVDAWGDRAACASEPRAAHKKHRSTNIRSKIAVIYTVCIKAHTVPGTRLCSR
jgi:hypothetical protein